MAGIKRKSNHEAELVADLQRLRADFENYRKNADKNKAHLAELTKAATLIKLLPIIDTIDRAIGHAPKELADNQWAQGVLGLGKSLDKLLGELQLSRINATPGTPFDPNLHEAVMMDEAEGEHEVIAEELRAGYKLGDHVLRPSMVKVTKQ